MQIEIIFMKPSDFGKKSGPYFIGKHLKPETADEIFRAIEDCSHDGFETLFIYARQPSKAVNEFVKQAQKEAAHMANEGLYSFEYIPGGPSGRGGYLIQFYNCNVCQDRGYLEVTHSDNCEYIEACQDCNGFTVGSMGDATGADERAQLQAIKDGYTLTKSGKIKG